MKLNHLLFAPLLASSAIACASVGEPPAQNADATGLPDAGADETYTVDFPAVKQPPARTMLMVVSEDFNTRCPGKEPHFEFDEARLQADDRERVAALARCFQDPLVRDRDIIVTGHADERGTLGYNDELALRRARAVSQALVGEGVRPERIYVTSAGERRAEASGSELIAHGWDRRVDVSLRDEVHAPLASQLKPYVEVRAASASR
ncbi:MAG: OmpA family protein [Myxococcota bacterium]